jgi:hypothetical protein
VGTIFTFNTRNKSGVTGRRHVYNRSLICYKGLSETYLQATGIFISYKMEKIPGYSVLPWEYNINMNIQKVGWGAWTGSSWLRIETGGGHL